MGKNRLKAGGRAQHVKISFERGRTGNGMLTQTKVFSISSKTLDEQKIKPNRTANNKRTNRGQDDYLLRLGKKYRIVTQRVNRGKTSCCSALLSIERTGVVKIEEWQGNFPPQFSLT
ncbi:hypothetical protein AMJ49_00745 [Parcubacteria bacterium DG_74_2]|nr:MAG: hypothetical protein AMJ49_00745 [Parcubacteria bacterium DG_74_2]